MDRLARQLVTLGGVLIIGSILAILLVIAYEVYPLFKKPTATPTGVAVPGSGSVPLALGVDEYREVAYLVTASGLQFLATKDGKPIAAPALPDLGGATVVAASPLGRGPGVLGTSDGRVIPVEVKFAVSHQGTIRAVRPDPIIGSAFRADPAGRPIRHLAHAVTKDGPITAATIGGREVLLVALKERKALVGPSVKEEIRTTLTIPDSGEIAALALDNRGEDLFIGTSAGEKLKCSMCSGPPP